MKDIRVRIIAAAMCCVLCLALAITGMGEGGIFDDIDLSTPAPDPVERTDETYPSYAEYSLCEPDVAETDEKDYIYQLHYNVFEEDFRGFGVMLGGQGWSVAAQDPQDNGVWLTLVNGERTFYILYSAEQRILIGSYPPGSVVIGAKEAKYLRAKELYASGDYKGAKEVFETLDGFADVDWLLKNDENINILFIGETVFFGNYPQGADGEVMPIEWTVLDIDEDGYYVLLSLYGLDAKTYHDQMEDVTWEKSALRTWLNGYFYNTAFTDEEQAYIKYTYLLNNDNFEYSTSGGNDVEDKVYLLSMDDITLYFGISQEDYYTQHDELYCRPSEYAIAQGAYTFDYIKHNNNEENVKFDGNSVWWLRSIGGYQTWANYIDYKGRVDYGGCPINQNNTVRPVVRVRFE